MWAEYNWKQWSPILSALLCSPTHLAAALTNQTDEVKSSDNMFIDYSAASNAAVFVAHEKRWMRPHTIIGIELLSFAQQLKSNFRS